MSKTLQTIQFMIDEKNGIDQEAMVRDAVFTIMKEVSNRQ
jgi:hypothetical protein